MSPAEEEADRRWLERLDALCRPPILESAADVLGKATVATAFLVPQRVPLEAVTLVIGEPGGGKSWIVYDLVCAVAQGRPWLGIMPDVTGPVLVANYDAPTPEVGRRFKRLGLLPSDPVFFHTTPEHALRLPAAFDDLAGIVTRLQPALVVLDSFRQAHTCDENSSQEMGIIMAQLKALYGRTGGAIVVVHHTAKGTASPTARGTGEIDGSCDARIAIVGDSALWSKHRSWPMAARDEALTFEVIDDTAETTRVSRAVKASKAEKPQSFFSSQNH